MRDMSLCAGCQACAEACPTLSVEVKGRDWDVDELVAELLKDRAYFEKSGGGITLLDVDQGPIDFATYIGAAQKAAAVAANYVGQSGGDPLTGTTLEIVQRQDCIKFLAYEGEDGYPWFIPMLHAIPVGLDRFIFAEELHTEDVKAIPAGAKVTLHCISMFTMEAVQFRCIYQGLQEGIGVIDIEQVYNPMVPRPSFIYPRKKLEPVTDF